MYVYTNIYKYTFSCTYVAIIIKEKETMKLWVGVHGRGSRKIKWDNLNGGGKVESYATSLILHFEQQSHKY